MSEFYGLEGNSSKIFSKGLWVIQTMAEKTTLVMTCGTGGNEVGPQTGNSVQALFTGWK
ncbi:hypothetical protein GIB67_012017 [Kingdonia uniflora]|uniref:Uncharacterized protein n=1 Tax=Kingdonia uniflora TaxID=39325 RepID=A0A7J7M080_9MAGN|nr:hypothetical protein GIB67_012017 [Kingdonia uniflora]